MSIWLLSFFQEDLCDFSSADALEDLESVLCQRYIDCE